MLSCRTERAHLRWSEIVIWDKACRDPMIEISTTEGVLFLSLLPNDGRKEGNVLFNDALNTFYLRLYGVRHMVKDHSDSERGNPLLPHGLLFPISSKGAFIPQTTAFVTPLAGTRYS